MFRNLTFFRFPPTLDFSALPELVVDAALEPVGPLEFHSQGFLHPYGLGHEAGVVQTGKAIWLTVGSESKILPGSAVNDALHKKVAEIEDREGQKIGARARKRIKDDLVHEMLPRALVKTGRTDAVLFPDLGLLVVDTSSRKRAEGVVSEIRGALGGFPALPVNAEVSPRSVMTAWLAGESMPDWLALGEDAELRDPMQGGGVVKIQSQELATAEGEVDEHLAAGKKVTKLGMALQDQLSFVIGEDLVVRKLRFLDGAMDKLPEIVEDARGELDARFALMYGEIRILFALLEAAFKISRAA